LLSVFIVIALVGCGSNSSNKPDSDSQSNGTNSEASDQKGKQIQLEYFSLKPEVVTVMDEIISDFMDENPNIKVTQTSVADAGTVLLTRIATADVPDILN